MMTVISVALACWGLAMGPAQAQELDFRVGQSEPPYYVGQAASVDFELEGFDPEPQPTVTIDSQTGELAEGLRGRMGQVSPSVMTQIATKNGRLYQVQRVTFSLQYLITADKPGEYVVGPFLIKQGTKQVKVEAKKFTFESVPTDPDLQVKLILPDTPLYVDQRVPVKIEWWYAGDTNNLEQRSIYSSLFDLFRFAPDDPPRRGTNVMPIETKDGAINLVGSAREVRQDGKDFIVLTSQRVMIPDRVGEFPDISISATIRKVTQWQRRRTRSPFDLFEGSLFDSRQPGKIEMGQARDTPRTLVVKPFPTPGRPKSFSGGIGTGFTLDVSADRTVVRVGDPIALTLLLKGDGNIDNAKLPDLSAEGGLNADQFRLPQGEVAGEFSDGLKKFRVSVRVASEGVSEIPAIAYSWFDPTTESYLTTHSKPIALRVMSAKVVGAGDVVSHQPAQKGNDNAVQSDDRNQASRTKDTLVRSPTFSLSGADLAINPDPAILNKSNRALNWKIWTHIIFYVLGSSLVAVATIDRRLRQRDPMQIAVRKCVRDQGQRIFRAMKLPRRQAAEQVAAALRQLISSVPSVPREQAQQIIGQCESICYAPAGGNDDPLDSDLIARAQKIIEACQV